MQNGMSIIREEIIQAQTKKKSPITFARKMYLTDLVISKLLNEKLILFEHGAIISWLARNERFQIGKISEETKIVPQKLLVMLDELYIWNIIQFSENGYFIKDLLETLNNLMIFSERANATKADNCATVFT